MSRFPRYGFGIGLVALLACLSIAVSGGLAQSKREPGQAGGKAAGELPRPILSTHDLMELFNKQVYLYTQEVLKEKPEDDDGWETIEERGLQAAEVMNLVAIRKMAREHEPAWKQLTSETQQAALGLTDAAKSRDFDKTKAAYGRLIQSCNNCHRKIAPDKAPQLEP